MRAALLIGLVMSAGCGKGKPTEGDAPAGDQEPGPPVAVGKLPDGRILAPKGAYRFDGVGVGVFAAELSGDNLVLFVLAGTKDEAKRIPVGKWEAGARVSTDGGDSLTVHPLDGVLESRVKIQLAEGGEFAVGPGVLLADRPRIQAVATDRPAPAVKYVDLELSAKVIGGDGEIRFRIPSEMWAQKNKILPR